jgi:hypothetical protein
MNSVFFEAKIGQSVLKSTIFLIIVVMLGPWFGYIITIITKKLFPNAYKIAYKRYPKYNNPKRVLRRNIATYYPILLSFFVVAYIFFVPIGYFVGKDSVVVRSSTKQIAEIPLTDIYEVLRDKKGIAKIGPWSSGGYARGLFGYFGRFYKPDLGVYTAYVTDMNRLVILKGRKTYVLSPKDPDRFTLLLSERINSLNGLRNKESE